eukprot:302091-Lingulodinium_polyedra.AAC.1
MRKAIDRRGRERHWGRMLPEHTWSTTGLLSILLGQIGCCRKPDPVEVEVVFKRFLEDRLRSEEVD